MESFSDFLKNKGYKTLSEAPGDENNSEVEDTEDYEMPSYDETPGDEDVTDTEDYDTPEELEQEQPNPAKENKGDIVQARSEKELYDTLIADEVEIEDFNKFKNREEITVYYKDRMFNIKLEHPENNVYRVQVPEDIKLFDSNSYTGTIDRIKKKLLGLGIEFDEGDISDLRLTNNFKAKYKDKSFIIQAILATPKTYKIHIPVTIVKL